MTRTLLSLLVALLSAAPARAQQPPVPPSPPDVDYAPITAAHPLPATAFAMPDLPDSWKTATAINRRWWSTQLGLVPLVDYTAFSQDGDSVSQVGEQEDQWDLRTFRIVFNGRVKSRHPVDYFVGVELKGKDHVQGDDSAVGFTDWYVGTSLGRLGTLRFGKVKEPWVYEVVGDAANLPPMERILSPFFVTRNIGLRLSNTMAGGRMSWAAGWFNDWWVMDQRYGDSGNQFAARFTGLPQWSADGADYVHVAASLRYAGPDNRVLRFRGRPESNISSYYVDTGDIPADHAASLSLEGAVGRGPFLLNSEWVRSSVDALDSTRPALWGAYVTVSYTLTGEHRPYDRQVAYARRILPQGRWGAWEIFARYSHLDLDDGPVRGGTMDKGAVGVTWWATRRWRLGVDLGITGLDRAGVYGRTISVHPRLQWVY